MLLTYGLEFTVVSRGFPATAWLLYYVGDIQTDGETDKDVAVIPLRDQHTTNVSDLAL